MKLKNRIRDISALRKLSNLKVLDLDGNEISDFSVVLTMSKLNQISLSENPIKDITPFSMLLDAGAFGDKEIPGGPSIKLSLKGLDMTAGSQNRFALDKLMAAGVRIDDQ